MNVYTIMYIHVQEVLSIDGISFSVLIYLKQQTKN